MKAPATSLMPSCRWPKPINYPFYDAVYLGLALKKHLPLTTLDNRLAAACRPAGVPTL